jgi:hypothetical protein
MDSAENPSVISSKIKDLSIDFNLRALSKLALSEYKSGTTTCQLFHLFIFFNP